MMKTLQVLGIIHYLPLFWLALAICGLASDKDVKQTLHRVLATEASGQSVNRAQELSGLTRNNVASASKPHQSAESTPYPLDAAFWQAGMVRFEGEWVPLDRLDIHASKGDAEKYYARRNGLTLDVHGHRAMAKWCKSQGMAELAQAHWYGVLGYSSSDIEARTELGHTLIGNRWFTRQELDSATTEAMAKVDACKKWMPTLSGIVSSIEGMDTQRRLRAIEELRKIQDPGIVHCLDVIVHQVTPETGGHLLQAIGKFQTRPACLSLTIIALGDPSSALGLAAIKKLHDYPLEFYVPDLLDLMSTEIELRNRVVTRANGELVLQLVQVRELRNNFEQKQLDSLLAIGTARPNGFFMNRLALIGTDSSMAGFVAGGTLDNLFATQMVGTEANRLSTEVSQSVAQANRTIQSAQRRIASVLRGVTEKDLDDSPQAWWDWWDRYEDSYEEGPKSTDYSYSEERRTLLYQNRRRADIGLSLAGPTGRRDRNNRTRHECLVAGTSIQTQSGLKPIEKIQVGDMVVSQNLGTGELGFKPVLRATERPEAPVCEIGLSNGESISATLGHRWWVIGRGWVKTKDLQVGNCLRTSTGSISIQTFQVLPSEKTYNLVIDQDHTYFVGQSRLLSFDASEAIPTFQKVPGLAAEIFKSK
jgi:hypothetical protein